MSFLFLWQTLLIGTFFDCLRRSRILRVHELHISPGCRIPHLVSVAVLVCLVNAWLLYRNIRSIDRLSIAMTVIVMATCCWVIISGAMHFHPAACLSTFRRAPFTCRGSFWTGLGATTLIAVYDYGGYNNVCLLGGEVEAAAQETSRAPSFSRFFWWLVFICS